MPATLVVKQKHKIRPGYSPKPARSGNKKFYLGINKPDQSPPATASPSARLRAQ